MKINGVEVGEDGPSSFQLKTVLEMSHAILTEDLSLTDRKVIALMLSRLAHAQDAFYDLQVATHRVRKELEST